MIHIAIADIHGMADKLDDLLESTETWQQANYPDTPAKLVFLGDYIDRGPKSREVLERVRGLQKQGAICLRGNHEALMIAAARSAAGMESFTLIGGDTTLRSLRSHDVFLEAAAWMSTLPLSFEDDRRFFVHAGVRPGVLLADQTDEDLLWIRKPFLDHGGPFEKFIVHGHSPTMFLTGRSRLPHVLPHRCNLDTGAVYGGPLSAGVFTDEKASPVALLSTARSLPPGGAR